MPRYLLLLLCLAAAPALADEKRAPAAPLPGATAGGPTGTGAWSLSGSSEGGFEARTADGETRRPKAAGETNLGAPRSCPGKGTWPTCY